MLHRMIYILQVLNTSLWVNFCEPFSFRENDNQLVSFQQKMLKYLNPFRPGPRRREKINLKFSFSYFQGSMKIEI